MISDYYNDLVEVERSTKTKDEYGSVVNSWSTHLSLKCAIQTRAGEKAITNGKQDALYSKRLYCDVVDIEETDRVIDGSNYYNIVGINPDLRGNHLQVDIQISSSGVS